MFYAKVIIGDTKVMNPDKNLKMPPLKDPKIETVRYDSVKGHTGGSDVYMIYLINQAYPEYLITYT
jgi:hypothetical protein